MDSKTLAPPSSAPRTTLQDGAPMHTTTAAPAPTARASGPFINRAFALLWAGQSVSNLGDWVFNTTLMLWIALGLGHTQPWAPAAVSGVLIARFVPTLLIGPLADVFVDRWDKRRTLLWADALRALLIALLAPVAVLASLPLAWRLGAVYGVVVFTTMCAQFFDPARLALIGDVVAESDRPRASGLEQVTSSLAFVVGPALAAPLYVALGAQWAILADALSFVISFLFVLRLRAPRLLLERVSNEPSHAGREFAAGLRIIASNRVLRTLFVAAIVAMLGFGSINALDIFFATGTLHVAAALYGFLEGSAAAGSLAGAIVGGLYAGWLGLTRMLWLSLVALGLLVLVYARLTSFGPALLVLFLMGIPNGTLTVVLNPLLLQVTPRAFVGRVSAVLMTVISVAALLSIAMSGLLDSTILHGFHARLLGVNVGPIDTIFSAAGLLGIAGGLYAFLNLRHVSGAPDMPDIYAPTTPAE